MPSISNKNSFFAFLFILLISITIFAFQNCSAIHLYGSSAASTENSVGAITLTVSFRNNNDINYTYIQGDNQSTNFPTVQWSSSDKTNCHLRDAPPSGFTVILSADPSGESGSFTFQPMQDILPGVTTGPAYSIWVDCVMEGQTVSNYLLLNVDPAPCGKVAQPSQGLVNGVVLQRQCSGYLYATSGFILNANPYFPRFSNGPVPYETTDALALLGSGAVFDLFINKGSYVALAFTPQPGYANGIKYVGTFGTSGQISLSKTPGDFTGSLGSACIVGFGQDLVGWTGSSRANPSPSNWCNIPADGKTTYYLNLAGLRDDGSPSTFSTAPPDGKCNVPINYVVQDGRCMYNDPVPLNYAYTLMP